MSDEKLYTEREVRDRERMAFCDGCSWRYEVAGGGLIESGELTNEYQRRYPITRKVSRRVRIGTCLYAEVRDGGVLFFRGEHGETRGQASMLEPAEIAKLADLLANPFEEVTE